MELLGKSFEVLRLVLAGGEELELMSLEGEDAEARGAAADAALAAGVLNAWSFLHISETSPEAARALARDACQETLATYEQHWPDASVDIQVQILTAVGSLGEVEVDEPALATVVRRERCIGFLAPRYHPHLHTLVELTAAVALARCGDDRAIAFCQWEEGLARSAPRQDAAIRLIGLIGRPQHWSMLAMLAWFTQKEPEILAAGRALARRGDISRDTLREMRNAMQQHAEHGRHDSVAIVLALLAIGEPRRYRPTVTWAATAPRAALRRAPPGPWATRRRRGACGF